MSTHRPTPKGKDTWTAHLSAWRRGAIGRLTHREVFLIAVLDRDRHRHIRVAIPADHARTLAADLLAAADRADQPDPYTTPRRTG